jgi:hypothetical protein
VRLQVQQSAMRAYLALLLRLQRARQLRSVRQPRLTVPLLSKAAP